MLHSKKYWFSALLVLLLGGSLLGAPSAMNVRAAPGKSPAQDNIVISEFQTRGLKGEYDEFIELFNPTADDINIKGWVLRRSRGCTDLITIPNLYTLVTIESSTILASGEHYLIASADSGIASSADTTYSPTSSKSIADDGGIALFDVTNQIIDKVGMCDTTSYVDTPSLAPLTTDDDRSYERNPGGSLGNCDDTDDNASDFSLLSPSNPRNSSGQPIVACIRPKVTISSTAHDPTNTPFLVTFTFSKIVTGFELTDIVVGHGAASDLAPVANPPGSGTAYTAKITPNVNDIVTVDVPAGVVNDVDLGNPNTAADQFSIVYDDIPPSVTITSTASATTNTSPIPISFTFSEPVTGFEVEDITVDNGIVGSFSGSGTTYTASITPVADGPVTVDVHANKAKDAAGNGNSAAPQFSITYYDITRPTVIISSTASGTTTTSPIPVTFTFSETVYEFARGDITVTNGTAKNFAGSGMKYTADIIPDAYGTVQVNVVENVAVDASGNGNKAAAQFSITYKKAPPATRTPTPSAPPAHAVISEFRTRGPLGDNDEFVEIYNPTGASINISGWKIYKTYGCTSSYASFVTIPSTPTILLPGQHYLAAAKGSSVVGADQTFTAGIADEAGIALVSVSNYIIDQVGTCTGTFFHDGTPLAPLLGTSDQSYERKPGGNTSCYDTNNNASDFKLRSPAKPQNMASARVLCAGAVTPTVSPTRTPTFTRTPTRAPTAYPGTIAINEFLPHPRLDWNDDGIANFGDEYIEIINMSVNAINLENWEFDDGEEGSEPYTLPDITLQPRQIARFFGSETGISLSDGGDTVRLIRPDGRTADIYTYPLVTMTDRAWCRLPDGNGAWGFVCRPTPGRPNELASSAASSTEGEPTTQSTSVCPLADTVPLAVRLAECDSFGSGIWNSAIEKLFWLPNRWKWDVFVK